MVNNRSVQYAEKHPAHYTVHRWRLPWNRIKRLNLEKAVVHETHETVLAGNPQSGCSQKTRTNSNAYPDLLHHPLGALL
ncbi:MAG: hypothetical protein Q7U37_05335, partial [Gallionella sp.]|nr:hypothetical protein [Gallionella sp.]